jgi:hypothetical protein
MFRTIIYAAVCICLATAAFAQPADQWLKEYGEDDHDEGWAICSTSDGAFVFVGKSLSPDRLNITKVDEFGYERWQREAIFGSTIRDVAETPDSGFVVVGTIGSNGLIAKVDRYGNARWFREIDPGPIVAMEAVTVMDNGDVVVTGRQDFSPVDLLLARYNSNGGVVWSFNFDNVTPDAVLAFDIDHTDAGAIIVFATLLEDGTGEKRINVLEFTGAGGFVDVLFDAEVNQSVLSGFAHDSGDFIIAGEREGEALAMRIDSEGAQAWEQVDATSSAFVACEQTPDGGFAFAGSAAPSGHTDFYAMKTDADGTVEWTETLVRPDDNYPKDMAVGSDGALYTIGFTDIGVGNSDAQLWAMGKEDRSPDFTMNFTVFNPSGTIPAAGGQLDYQLFLNNETGTAEEVSLFREGFTPDQELLTIANYPVILQPGFNPGFGSQIVPEYLDPGPYTFIFRITTADTDSLLATGSYVFRKLAAAE